MRFQPAPLGGSPLVADYLAGEPAAADFFPAGSPFSSESYRSRARELEGTEAHRLAARTLPMIRTPGPAAERALEAVVRGKGWFVTTGQQPGLFGGPLYSLYKALTAVRLAERLAALLGRPVMPVFWIASDDHDWAEANQAHVVDQANELRSFSLATQPPAAAPMSRATLGDGVGEAVRRLAECFPRNDFRDRFSRLLARTHHPAATMASAFSDLLAELLADTPIGLADAADPTLKSASLPLLRAEADDSAASEAAVRLTSDEIVRRGYPLQAAVIDDAAHLFLDGERGRERLVRDGGGFRLRRSGRALARADLLAAIESDPASVSPSVLLRPVVESFVFPTLAYVGGPGEIAYFAQLGGLFRRHGLTMPVVAPRASLTVVESRVQRVMDKFKVGAEELREGEALLTRLALDRVPDEVARAIEGWRDDLTVRAAQAGRAASELDATLGGAVTRARNAGLAAVGTMEKKIVRSVKRRHREAWSQTSKASVHLWPGGRPQDRVLSALQYLFWYGEAFVPEALTAVEVDVR